MRSRKVSAKHDSHQGVDLTAAGIAGLAGGLAYLLVLEADLRLTGNNVDDLLILGRPFTHDRATARRIGGVIHVVNALALGMVYAHVQRWLPGPSWLRGLTFANVENAVLYPVTMWEDRHPAVREGQVDRYWRWRSFLQSIPRHVAFGMVMGIIFERMAAKGMVAKADTRRK